jgi:hypothetical protein
MDHRMTVVRSANGKLLVHSPVEYSPEIGRALLELGSPEWFVAPSRFHDMYWPAWFQAFPQCRFAAVYGMTRDHSHLPFSDVLEDGFGFWDGEVQTLALGGIPRLNEVALLHHGSRSLLVADLLFNIDAKEQNVLGRLFLRLNGVYQKAGISRIFRSYIKDRKAFQESLLAVQERDFDRIIIGHGPNLGGREVLAKAATEAGFAGK